MTPPPNRHRMFPTILFSIQSQLISLFLDRKTVAISIKHPERQEVLPQGWHMLNILDPTHMVILVFLIPTIYVCTVIPPLTTRYKGNTNRWIRWWRSNYIDIAVSTKIFLWPKIRNDLYWQILQLCRQTATFVMLRWVNCCNSFRPKLTSLFCRYLQSTNNEVWCHCGLFIFGFTWISNIILLNISKK